MTWVAGVDGCRAGWLVVLRNLSTGRSSQRVARSFREVLGLQEAPTIVAVDIPIGLLEHAQKGGRAPDREARRLLGRRGCCVFSPPVRSALGQPDYRSADAANRASSPAGMGISRQAWGISAKIAEVDALMTSSMQTRVREAHPELAFFEMGGGRPVPGKRSAGGLMERAGLLHAAGFYDPRTEKPPGPGVGLDDVLDAHAMCWTAARIGEGKAARLPERPPRDSRGLRMEVWR